MNLLKTKILTILTLSLLTLPGLSLAPAAYADDLKAGVCGGTGFKLGKGGCDGSAQRSTLETTINTIVNILSAVVGIVAVVMIIIGGFKYITSGGDSGNITSAKHTIIYALVGLIIVALAQVIVRFILSNT